MRDPVQVERIGLPPEIAKILHHDEGLVVILVVDLRAFGDFSQHLSSRSRPIAQRGNPEVTRLMRSAGCRKQGIDDVPTPFT